MSSSISLLPGLILAFVLLVLLAPLVALLFRESKRVQFVAALLLLPSLLSVGFLILSVDQSFGLSASWFFCLGAFLFTAFLSVTTFWRHHRWIGFYLTGLFAAAFISLHFVDLSPVKPYQRFYRAIREGMTKHEVIVALRHEFPESGPFPLPVMNTDDPERMTFLLDPPEGDFNAEGIFLTLRNEKVVAKEYKPD